MKSAISIQKVTLAKHRCWSKTQRKQSLLTILNLWSPQQEASSQMKEFSKFSLFFNCLSLSKSGKRMVAAKMSKRGITLFIQTKKVSWAATFYLMIMSNQQELFFSTWSQLDRSQPGFERDWKDRSDSMRWTNEKPFFRAEHRDQESFCVRRRRRRRRRCRRRLEGRPMYAGRKWRWRI